MREGLVSRDQDRVMKIEKVRENQEKLAKEDADKVLKMLSKKEKKEKYMVSTQKEARIVIKHKREKLQSKLDLAKKFVGKSVANTEKESVFMYNNNVREIESRIKDH